MGRNLRDLIAVVGEESLTSVVKKYLEFANRFEKEFLQQGFYEARGIFLNIRISMGSIIGSPRG